MGHVIAAAVCAWPAWAAGVESAASDRAANSRARVDLGIITPFGRRSGGGLPTLRLVPVLLTAFSHPDNKTGKSVYKFRERP
jgi:hypothetical protein